MRIILAIDLPDDITQHGEGTAIIKRAAKSGIITEYLAYFRQRKGIRGQSRDADRYLELLRERVVVSEVTP